MGEKDMHESELNAAQPARRPKKKKRGRAGKVIRKTVKIAVALVLAVGVGLTLTLAVDELDIRSVQPGQRVALSVDALSDAGYCVTLESGETRRVTLGVMTDETTQILDGIGVGETVVY